MSPLSGILILALFATLGQAFDKFPLKDEWQYEVKVPKENVYVKSSNDPTYAVIVTDPNDVHKVAATIKTMAKDGVKLSCHFEFNNEDNETIPGYVYQMKSAGNGIEILSYDRYKDLQTVTTLFVIDMKTCGLIRLQKKVTSDKLRYNFKYISPFKDSIDVFYTNTSDCNDKPCKWRYNLTTEEWSGPIIFNDVFLKADMELMSGVSHLADGSRFLFLIDNPVNQTIVSSDATSTTWANLGGEPTYSLNSTNDLSVANGAVGNCYALTDTKLSCQRMDLDLKPTLETEVVQDNIKEILYVGAHNTKDGGMLAFAGYCSQEADYRCKEYEIDVTKINADGQKEPTKEFAKLDCSPMNLDFSIFYEEGDKTCARFMCFLGYFEKERTIRNFVKCF